MRIWLDALRMSALNITPDDVSNAIKAQNVQAAAGSIGSEGENNFIQYKVNVTGRLQTVEEFSKIIVRTGQDGHVTRLDDIARIELGAETYTGSSRNNGEDSVNMAVYRLDDANALEAMNGVKDTLEKLEKRFPEGVSYVVSYDPTQYISATMAEIVETLVNRPDSGGGHHVPVPAGLARHAHSGARHSRLPDRNLRHPAAPGLFHQCADHVRPYSGNRVPGGRRHHRGGKYDAHSGDGGSLAGRSHQEEHAPDYRRHHRHHAGDGSHLRAHRLLRRHGGEHLHAILRNHVRGPLPFRNQFPDAQPRAVRSAAEKEAKKETEQVQPLPPPFNASLEWARKSYIKCAGIMVRRAWLTLILLAAVLVGNWKLFETVPKSFLPPEDKGTVFCDIQLAPGATLGRTEQAMRSAEQKLMSIPGVRQVSSTSGFSFMGGNGENLGMCIAQLDPWDKRKTPELSLDSIMQKASVLCDEIPAAKATVFSPPAIMGLGLTGGVSFMLQASGEETPKDLERVTNDLLDKINKLPGTMYARSAYEANTPPAFPEHRP